MAARAAPLRGGPPAAAAGWRPLRWLAMLLLVVVGVTGCSVPSLGFTWVHSGEHVVADGEHQPGPLVVTGGVARLAAGSLSDGPVLLMGGVLIVDGLVTGPVWSIGGAMTLGDLAFVHGGVGAVGGFERHPDAMVLGGVMDLPGVLALDGAGAWWRVLGQAFVVAVWAAAWARRAPRRLRSIGRASVRRPAAAAAVGALTLLLGSLAALSAFTGGYPVVAAALAVLLAAGLATGCAAVGFAVATALTRGPLRELEGRPTLLAAIGGFDAALLIGLVGMLGWGGAVGAGIAAAVAFGAVVVSGFGATPLDRRGALAVPARGPRA